MLNRVPFPWCSNYWRQEAPEDTDELSSGFVQLGAVVDGEFSEELLSLSGHVNGHLPSIISIALSFHQSSFCTAIDQSHRSVMPDLQTLCEEPDCGLHVQRETTDGE